MIQTIENVKVIAEKHNDGAITITLVNGNEDRTHTIIKNPTKGQYAFFMLR